jgi:nucleoside-diphosphate-sugar epimerase
MKIVVTGAAGFIGSILANRLWDQFHALILLSRRAVGAIKPVTRQRRVERGVVASPQVMRARNLKDWSAR